MINLHFKQPFSSIKKKNTQNVPYVFACSMFLQPIIAARKTVINSSRANLSLDLLSFFLQNDSLVFSSPSTFHLCISSVYFTVRRGDLLNLPKFYRASSVSWRDQSERSIYFCYVISWKYSWHLIYLFPLDLMSK